MTEIKTLRKAAKQLEQLPHAQKLVALAFVEGLLAQMQIEASERKKQEEGQRNA